MAVRMAPHRCASEYLLHDQATSVCLSHQLTECVMVHRRLEVVTSALQPRKSLREDETRGVSRLRRLKALPQNVGRPS